MSEHDEAPFRLPLPPLPPGTPPGPHDQVFFIRTEAPPRVEPERGTEDILMRRVPAETAQRFRAAAGGRAMTHAQYLVALVGLHQRLRELADQGNEDAKRELEALGLTTVTV
jgi:hypothetical protein